VERHEPPALIETPRLRGERIGPEHEDALLTVLGDPRVGATLGGTMTREEVRALIGRDAEHWDEHGFGCWTFFDRETGAVIARGGISHADVEGDDEIEVAWAVAPDRWGQGYATELGAASVDVAFGRLGLPRLVSFTLVDNASSRRVMEKLGFEYVREIVHADLPHVLYRLQSPSDSTS
jgi:ribosomal-protein-alanine N-acetyltransferase